MCDMSSILVTETREEGTCGLSEQYSWKSRRKAKQNNNSGENE